MNLTEKLQKKRLQMLVLRDNKDCSIDNILYEYFTVRSNIPVDVLYLLLNILDTGDVPSYWTRCIIRKVTLRILIIIEVYHR